jgi:hypothetical protein
MDGFDVVPSVPVVIGGDPRLCADAVRPYAALYLGGMGSREKNFYNALAVRMGFAEAAATVQELYLDRRHRDAMAAIPFDFLDQTSLLGDRRPASEAGRVRCHHLLGRSLRKLHPGKAERAEGRRRGAQPCRRGLAAYQCEPCA